MKNDRDLARSAVRKTAIEVLLEAATSGRFVDEIQKNKVQKDNQESEAC